MKSAFKRVGMFVFFVLFSFVFIFPSLAETNGDSAAAESFIAQAPTSGTGILGNPYIIKTPEHLVWFAENYNRSSSQQYFRLGGNIDFGGQEFEMISRTEENAFRGVFDSEEEGYIISNVKIIYSAGLTSYGLFGYIGGGKVEDINLFNVNIDLISKNAENVGGIAGEIFRSEILPGVFESSIIKDCTVSSSRLTGYRNVGGIAGVVSESTIGNSNVFSSHINAQINAAGVAASTKEQNNTISGCTSTNNNIFAETYTIVAGRDSVAAGIVANSLNTAITDCSSAGNNILSQRYTAGVVGIAYGTSISFCYNTSTVKGKDGTSFEGISSLPGAAGMDGMEGTNGTDGKPGETGANGGFGGSAGGLVCMFDYASSISNSFNAGLITSGKGGNGGKGGEGGKGGAGGLGADDGIGGNGGEGGNGGNGGSAGAIFTFYINNLLMPVNLYSIIDTESVFTRPGMVSLGEENGNNGGIAGVGGNGGLGGREENEQLKGSAGERGKNGNNGTIVRLRNYANVVTEDRTAKIIFNYNGGTEGISEKKVDFGTALGQLPHPTKIGFRFIGWNTDADGEGKFVDENSLFLFFGNTELFAIYAPTVEFSIRINSNNGTSVVNRTFNANVIVIQELTIPVRLGYAFDGWYIDSSFTRELTATMTAEDVGNNSTVYAKWLREIRINFVVSGGTLNNGGQTYLTKVSERQLGNLPTATPSASGSYFGGWYRDLADTSTLVSMTTVFIYDTAPLVNGEVTLYARWLTNSFLEYNMMGGDGIDECSIEWDGTRAAAYAGGVGSVANPFQITDARQLAKMAYDINNTVASGYSNFSGQTARNSAYILTNNIDLANRLWDPIGKDGTTTRRFEGNFHGNGFYIKNINVSVNLNNVAASSRYFMGLFGSAYNAEISQIGLESGKIELIMTGTGAISNTRMYVGSVIGYCAGSTVVDQCYSNLEVNVNVNRSINLDLEAYVGGLIGRLDNGSYEWTGAAATSTFRDSYNNGKVTSYFNYTSGRIYNFVGGIIGYVYRSNFANVFNTAEIDIKSVQNASSATASTIAFAGGICGEINSGGNLANCFNTGKVSSFGQANGNDRRVEVGGIVAHLNDSAGRITINGCKNYGELYSTRVGSTSMGYGGDGLGGIIGLIVGSSGVTGTNNQYKEGRLFYRTSATANFQLYKNGKVGIDIYNNGSNRTNEGTNGAGSTTNANHVISGSVVNLEAHGYSDNYGQGVFEFTSTNYFTTSAYFINPSSVSNSSVSMTQGVDRWNFQSIWEFRLDRNDNLPLLKYMCYLTEFSNGELTPNRKYVYTNERVGRLITPTKTGYIFAGWWNRPIEFDPELGTLGYGGMAVVDGENGFIEYVGKNPYSLQDNNSTFFRGVDNIQIYAGWLPEEAAVNVTLNNNEATGRPATTVIQAFRGYPLKQLYTPTRIGHKFIGWFTAANAEYTNETIYTAAEGITLTARWQANEYTLSLNPLEELGGFVSTRIYKATYGTTINMIPIPYRFGYTFLGWETEGGNLINNGTFFDYDSDLDLTAKWSTNSYDIIFNKNESSIPGTVTGTMNNQTMAYGSTPQLLSELRYSAAGYVFLGWALTPTGGVVYSYDDHGIAYYTMDTEGDKTFFAVWKAETFYVRMYINGGTVPKTTSLIVDGTANSRIGLPMYPTLTKVGYDFGGWFYDAQFGNECKKDSQGRYYVTISSSDIDVYAKWNEKTFYINFDRNPEIGGQEMTPQTVQVSNPISDLRENTFTRTGYTFGGWLSPDGLVVYADKAGLTLTKELEAYAKGEYSNQITLRAIWVPNPITVSFDGNHPDVQNTMNQQPFFYEQPRKLEKNLFTVLGYQFMGWATSASGAVVYTDMSEASFTADITLHAVWSEITYTIEFRSGGQVVTKTAKFGQQIELIDNPFEKKGSSFLGWCFVNRIDDDYILHSEREMLLIGVYEANFASSNNIITLYAIWQVEKYPLKVFKNDTRTDYIVIDDVPYGELFSYSSYINELERPGYNFIGLKLINNKPAEYNGFILINEDFFDGNELLELVAVHEGISIQITGIREGKSVRYKEETELTVTVSPFDWGLTFSISAGFTIDENTGKIKITAQNMNVIEFTVYVIHENGKTASYAFTVANNSAITVQKQALTIAKYGSGENFANFVYTGLPQNLNYVFGNMADEITSTVTYNEAFIGAGVYQATITLDAYWREFYTLGDGYSAVISVTIGKAKLTVTGNDAQKIYYTENPKNFSSTEPVGFVNGESFVLAIGYHTYCLLESAAGNYTIFQTVSTELDNYYIEYKNGELTVLPILLSDASITIHVGEAGYVEGSKLYFNSEDINFGVNGTFTESDYSIVWEWSTSTDGTWTALDKETTNQLILTKYKLGIEVEGLYFRVRITGKGNINSQSVAVSEVGADDKIVAAPVAPFLPEPVFYTLIALSGILIIALMFMIVFSVRSKKIIKRIKERDLRG